MTTNDTGILGPDGKKLKAITVPVVKFRDFQFKFEGFDRNRIAKEYKGGYRPRDLVHEYRARCLELEDRLQILMAVLCTTIVEGPDAGKEFLDSIGASVTDFDGKVLYKPSPVSKN